MKGRKAPTVTRVSIESLNQVLSDVLDGMDLSPPENPIPGWYMMAAFEIDTVHVPLANPDGLGRQSVRVQVIDETDAGALVELAQSNPEAYDLAAYIAGVQMAHGGGDFARSATIKLFGAQVLCGQIPRPPRKGRPKGVDAHIRVLQYALCRWVEATSELHLMRNSNSKKDRISAIDAVVKAFAARGMHYTYSSIENVHKADSYSDVRLISHLVHPTPKVKG